MKKNSWLIKPRPRPKILQYEAVEIAFLAHFHNILELNIKMQQQLFHWLRNAKQLNIWNNKGKWDSRNETRKNYETKFYFWRNKTKRNEMKFRCFIVSRNKQNFTKQTFCFALFRVSRNKKKDAKWKPYIWPVFDQIHIRVGPFFYTFFTFWTKDIQGSVVPLVNTWTIAKKVFFKVNLPLSQRSLLFGSCTIYVGVNKFSHNVGLKGQCHEIFNPRFFSSNNPP
jgi:hypothetical protein